MLALIVRANFRKINFCNCHRLRKYYHNENFQIYGTEHKMHMIEVSALMIAIYFPISCRDSIVDVSL